MSEIKSYKDLRIWQLGIEIVKQIYIVTKNFPKSELYGLTSQIQRAAVSIPSNIAEGNNRIHKKEFVQFLNIALGSCAEMETQIIIAIDLGYIDSLKGNELLDKLDSEGKQIRSLISKMQNFRDTSI